MYSLVSRSEPRFPLLIGFMALIPNQSIAYAPLAQFGREELMISRCQTPGNGRYLVASAHSCTARWSNAAPSSGKMKRSLVNSSTAAWYRAL
jgi:hypothetical protein